MCRVPRRARLRRDLASLGGGSQIALARSARAGDDAGAARRWSDEDGRCRGALPPSPSGDSPGIFRDSEGRVLQAEVAEHGGELLGDVLGDQAGAEAARAFDVEPGGGFGGAQGHEAAGEQAGD